MRAGSRIHRIVIERKAKAQDANGEEIETWSPLGRAMAQVFFGRGDERRQAAQEGGSQTATFGVLATGLTRGVGYADRIAFGGADWDITGIAPDTPKRGEIEFTGVRAA